MEVITTDNSSMPIERSVPHKKLLRKLRHVNRKKKITNKEQPSCTPEKSMPWITAKGNASIACNPPKSKRQTKDNPIAKYSFNQGNGETANAIPVYMTAIAGKETNKLPNKK